ncbi:GATA-domain-containing protein [Lichtheimia hyalospora FSU 10163]|nr:GATA-domain-containing protein [Lichtheimia hyalospora FSU 10163]
MSGHSQQHRLPSIRDLEASSGSTTHHTSNIILPPLTPPVLDSLPSSSSAIHHHHPSPPPPPPPPPPQRTQRTVEVDLSEAIETCYMLCQQIEKLQDEWPNRDIQEQLDELYKTSIDLLQLIREPAAPVIGHVSKPEYAMIRRARNLQEGMGMTYRRRTKKTTQVASSVGQRCHSCNTTETPEWRRGPDGARTLCNACGLHYSKLLRRGSMTVQRMQSSIPPRVIDFPQGSPTSCNEDTRILPQPMGIGIGYNTATPPPLPSLLPPHSDTEQMPLDYQ